MKALRYDYRDVFGAAALGLRVRKWLVAVPALGAGVLWWALCAWGAALARGMPPRIIWRVYGPVPWPSLASVGGFVPGVLWVVGGVGLGVAFLLASAAVGRVTYRQLKGDDFFSLADAWRFTGRKWKAVVLPVVFIAIAAALLVALLVVVSWGGRLWSPLWGILFPIGLIGGLSLLYLVLVAGLACTVAPAVVASSSSETLETTFELFSLQSSQGKRTWLYTTVGTLISAVYTVAMGLFVAVAALLTSWVMDMGHAGAVGRLLRSSLGWAPRVAKAINGVPGIVDSIRAGLGVQSPPSYGAYVLAAPASAVGGAVVAVVLFLILLLLLAQFTATFATCQTTSYVVLRQLKDDQNLLEEDMEE